jgi:hypothetical protein
LAIEAIIAEIDKGELEKLSTAMNIMFQSLNDFKPKDAVEARLASQAAVLYQHGMDRLRQAGRADRSAHAEAEINMSIKLLRCHNETIEAINRYRRGGEQKVTVTHAVLANQAVVNNNYSGGGGVAENKGDTPC